MDHPVKSGTNMFCLLEVDSADHTIILSMMFETVWITLFIYFVF